MTDFKDKSIRIKKGEGRKAQWGRLTGKVEIDEEGHEYYWAERYTQGGTIPLYREEFVLKRRKIHMKFTDLKATGRVSRGKAWDRGRAGG